MKYLKSIVLALLVFLSSCSTAPKDNPAVASATPIGDDMPIRSIKPIDQTVVVSVKTNLRTDAELAVADLDVKAENDLLVLRGTVNSEEVKARAEAIAKRTPGVEKIANHIEVAGE